MVLVLALLLGGGFWVGVPVVSCRAGQYNDTFNMSGFVLVWGFSWGVENLTVTELGGGGFARQSCGSGERKAGAR